MYKLISLHNPEGSSDEGSAADELAVVGYRMLGEGLNKPQIITKEHDINKHNNLSIT